MIDSGLGDLIGLVADKGMRGEKLKKLNNNIDGTKTLMDDIKQLMDMDDNHVKRNEREEFAKIFIIPYNVPGFSPELHSL